MCGLQRISTMMRNMEEGHRTADPNTNNSQSSVAFLFQTAVSNDLYPSGYQSVQDLNKGLE